MDKCVSDTDATLKVLPPLTRQNIQPHVTPERAEAVMAHTYAKLMAECARRACRFDVRECVKVRDYEETVERLRKALD